MKGKGLSIIHSFFGIFNHFAVEKMDGPCSLDIFDQLHLFKQAISKEHEYMNTPSPVKYRTMYGSAPPWG